MEVLVRSRTHNTASASPALPESETQLDFVSLSYLAEGYTPADIRDLVDNAMQGMIIRMMEGSSQVSEVPSLPVQRSVLNPSYFLPKQRGLVQDDFVRAAEESKPRSLRDVKLQTSQIAWSDIGGEPCIDQTERYRLDCYLTGLYETRRVLRETLEWPTKYGAIFAKCPLRLRSG